MSTVDPFVYPMIARSLALFALSVVAAAERRENDATLRLELTLTTRADACTATFRVARRTMSHPEAFMRAFAEMLDAYGLERQTKMFSHAVLFVSTASDCAVRFAKSLGAEWTRHVVDVDGDEVQCWFVLDFEWLGANGARDSRATFLRDTFGLFLDGLRAAMLFVHIQRARVDDVVYEAPTVDGKRVDCIRELRSTHRDLGFDLGRHRARCRWIDRESPVRRPRRRFGVHQRKFDAVASGSRDG